MKQTVPVRRSLRTGRLSSKSAMTTKWDSGNLCGQLPHRREGPARNTVRASTHTPLPIRMCVDRHQWRVLSNSTASYSFPLSVREVFSSTPLPGFSGLASSVLHANLPPSAPFPLGLVGLLRFGFLMPVDDFLGIRAAGLPWVRLYNLPTYRPPAHRFD